MRDHVASMIEFQKQGSHVFDYGNTQDRSFNCGLQNAFHFRDLSRHTLTAFCEGYGPFRYGASGDPEDIYKPTKLF